MEPVHHHAPGHGQEDRADELPGPTGKPFTLVKVNEGDHGLGAADGWQDEVLLVTAEGMAIRFARMRCARWGWRRRA